jgi:hypothetical protein
VTDIAQKAKAEAERKKLEAQKREQEKKAEAKRAEEKAAEQKKQEDKRQAELRERQERELQSMRREAERETQSRQQVEREKQLRDAANRALQDRQRAAAQQASDAAGRRAIAEWVDRIRSKVKKRSGRPIWQSSAWSSDAAAFVRSSRREIAKSSGNAHYDDATSAPSSSPPLPSRSRRSVPARAGVRVRRGTGPPRQLRFLSEITAPAPSAR